MPNHLRILFVTNNYTPYSGGVVSSIQAFTKELQHMGHEVFIITLDFLGPKHNDPEYVFRVPCPIKFLYKNNHMALPVHAYYHMEKLIRDIRPYIVHSHHPFLLGKTALDIAKSYSIPVVFTHHSLYEHWTHVVPLPETVTCPLVKAYVKRYCNQVAGIIAPSTFVKEYLIEQGVMQPIAVMPSGLQEIFEPKANFSEKKLLIDRPFELLSVTRFSKEKNVPFLVNLICKLSQNNQNYRMKLVGYGALWNEIKHYAFDQLQLKAHSIRFLHKPLKASLAKSYSQADLFIFSSQTDTQGLVLAEAMAAGTPVIALDGAGQRDIVDQDSNGFIVQDMQEMINLIERIKQDQDLFKKLCYNSWQTAHRYKISNLAANLVEFYNQFI